MKPIKVLALGDSYTIGEGVDYEKSWPGFFENELRKLELTPTVKVVAKTGWTTQDLMEAIEAENFQPPYDLVFLLIGVNNQYQGKSPEDYQADFEKLLKQSISFAGGQTKHVFVLSIPDWSVTPYAKDHDRKVVAEEVNAFNKINARLAYQSGTHYVNITEKSQLAKFDRSMLVADELHPSGVMYRLWVKHFLARAVAELDIPNAEIHQGYVKSKE